MAESFENLNKQIASFIILSAALSAPVNADTISATNNNLIADASISMPAQIGHNEIIAMYAAPQIPIGEIIKPTPMPEVPPAISMYAAPQHPIIIEPTPVPAPILRYAAPNFPFKPIKPSEKIQMQKEAPALNESSLNINKVNSTNMQAGVNTAASIKHSAGNIRTQDFVITDYGNVRIIEPFSHIIFK